MAKLIRDNYITYKAECLSRFNQLKANEEELNRIFIDIYGLQDELTSEVKERDVTVYRIIDEPDEEQRKMAYVLSMKDEVVSLLSYIVGCILGRYSPYVEGLLFAGGEWDFDAIAARIAEGAKECDFYDPVQGLFLPDRDAIVPVTDDEYFTDDIVGRTVEFVSKIYGKETLEENLKFIADALGGSGTPRDIIRGYFPNNFYTNHLKTYQKRPIYWLFDSGKKNGFKALIYMHRYAPDTIARIRTDYVHEQQSRYRTAISDLENRISSASTSERVKLIRQLNKVNAQAEELRVYEEKIHHLADQMIPIDLDDGVKVNYAKFTDVLAKIK